MLILSDFVAAYVDSSAVVAVARDEANAEAVSHRLANFRLLISSNLLEAEVSAVLPVKGVNSNLNRLKTSSG